MGNPGGGLRARKLIRVTFDGTTATSNKVEVWAYNPATAAYEWFEQNDTAFAFDGMALGSLIMPAGWVTADLILMVCATATGTFVPYKIDNTNGFVNGGERTAIDGAIASEAYAMPPYWFGAGPYCKLRSVADYSAGSLTNTNQTDKAVEIWLIS